MYALWYLGYGGEGTKLNPKTPADVMYRALAKPLKTVKELLDAEVEVQWFQKSFFESCTWVQ